MTKESINTSKKINTSSTKVYQGNQIGGCVTVITASKGEEVHRIMIDYGSSLPGSEIKEDFKYPWNEEPIDAVLFTHYHGDHVGRLLEIPEDVPIYMGPVAREVMLNIHYYMMQAKGKEYQEHKKAYDVLKDDRRIRTYQYNDTDKRFDSINDIPLFKIEPYSVDHSAYDAYMFLIEAFDESKENNKKVIVHTGDFRGHGRRGKAMLNMVYYFIHQNKGLRKVREHNNREVDELIIEGTMMSRPSEVVRTEYEMQKEAEIFFKTHKHVFLICSSTNLDSLASFYMAWKNVNKSSKTCLYVYSNYLKAQLRTFSNTAGKFSPVYKFDNVYRLNLSDPIEHPTWNKPKTQKELMAEKGFLAIIKADDFCEEYIDAFMECEDKPVIIFSLWEDYLNENHPACDKKMAAFMRRQEKEKNIHVEYLHTSGHATAKMIKDVIVAVAPRDAIIPMHTEKADAFKLLDIDEKYVNIMSK